jgi:hypothetical protein
MSAAEIPQLKTKLILPISIGLSDVKSGFFQAIASFDQPTTIDKKWIERFLVNPYWKNSDVVGWLDGRHLSQILESERVSRIEILK